MIARISGFLFSKLPTHIVVDVSGIGYRIFVPLTTFYELPEVGQRVTLTIHTLVKPDSINLFGFLSSAERDVFQLMLAVNGIGPKLAISILSGIAAAELLDAISRGDWRRLVSIPGVGKKMAERIILELKDKAAKLVSPDRETKGTSDQAYDDLREDALSAMINLGYKQQAAEAALDKVCRATPFPVTLNVLLKNTLKLLAAQ